MKDKLIGHRFDGGHSPLGKRDFDIGEFPNSLTSSHILGGDLLGTRGAYPDNINLSRRQRTDLHNDLVKFLKEKLHERDTKKEALDYESTYEALLAGLDEDAVELVSRSGERLRSTVGKLRAALRVSVTEFFSLPPAEKLKRIRRAIDRMIANQKIAQLTTEDRLLRGMESAATDRDEPTMRKMFDMDDESHKQARTDLHHRLLREWCRGPLKLERPQGSSLHHMVEYSRGNAHALLSEKGPAKMSELQIVLVENDWGAAVPNVEGEWRVPFSFMCWEFRLTGVRVLAFTEADTSPPRMWCIYGRDGHWVADDYGYELGCAALPPGVPIDDHTTCEFRRVAKFCYDTIRASCIMLDAQVARHERVAVSTKLKERRARDQRAPLRDHYVVRLLHEERRAYRARSAGASVAHSGDARAPQRGHWRKGTWVHYDDQDSGQVQYTNDGGFVVSKTWRRWHFAGNPNNIIHKEYRV